MSDVMLLGVLRMPIEYVGGPLSPMAQFVSRAREAADRIEADADTISAERSSRGMFVARLEKMQENGDTWLTVQSVFALLNDCDMLASQEANLNTKLDANHANVIITHGPELKP